MELLHATAELNSSSVSFALIHKHPKIMQSAACTFLGVQQFGRAQSASRGRGALSRSFPRLHHCLKPRALQARQDAEARPTARYGLAGTVRMMNMPMSFRFKRAEFSAVERLPACLPSEPPSPPPVLISAAHPLHVQH